MDNQWPLRHTPSSSLARTCGPGRTRSGLDPVNTSHTPSPALDSDHEDSAILSPLSIDSPSTPVLQAMIVPPELLHGSPKSRKERRRDGSPNPELEVQGVRVSSEPIGRGAFSQVFKAVVDGRVYAIKARRKTVNPEILSREADILENLNANGGHPGVLGFHGWFGSSTTQLLLDYYASNLSDHVKSIRDAQARRQTLNAHDAVSFSFDEMSSPIVGKPRWFEWSRQLASALRYIHSHNVVHGDLKPYNILVNEPGDRLVIADFSSASYSSDPREAAYTPVFSAPEIRNGDAVSFSSDIYALGLVLLFCAAGSEPYSLAKNAQQRIMWQKSVSPIDSYDPETQQRIRLVSDLINRLLARSSLDSFLAEVDRQQTAGNSEPPLRAD